MKWIESSTFFNSFFLPCRLFCFVPSRNSWNRVCNNFGISLRDTVSDDVYYFDLTANLISAGCRRNEFVLLLLIFSLSLSSLTLLLCVWEFVGKRMREKVKVVGESLNYVVWAKCDSSRHQLVEMLISTRVDVQRRSHDF